MLNKKIYKILGIAACSVLVEGQLYILKKNNYDRNNNIPTPTILKRFVLEDATADQQLYLLDNINYKSPKIKPLKDYIPKDASQQELFLSKYPSFDGREIKIAIIDSGVDVSLDGLQKTSDGLPKIIDCFDFTGAGDVDTSVVREMDSERILIGLSGRKLKIPEKWKNPSGKWHVGIKALQKPLSMPRQTRRYPRRTISDDEETQVPTPKSKQIKTLPEMDCIVWLDGERWLACIDTWNDDLENAKVLTNFQDEHQYGILTFHQQNIAYCINVRNDGNLLEIFAPAFYHGSAVAQVAAANFPNEPERNGLAPGAQIISMNILSPCLKGTELKNALLKCIEMKVDIVNYSVVGLVRDEETEKLIKEMVEKHNILIFKSAGNFGPFYSSLNIKDLSVQELIFTIGALLTPKMKKLIYNIKGIEDNHPSFISKFSSRGPAANGYHGIDFVAPGAAITEQPKFNSIKYLMSQGTSFAAPNAAGSVACLLSALKANSIQYTPEMIKSALSKTAILPENGSKLEFGHGIIQIDAAFDYCKNMMNKNIKSNEAKKLNIFYIHKDDNQTVKQFSIQLPSVNHTVDVEVDGSENLKNIMDLSCADDTVDEEIDAKNVDTKRIFKLSPEAEKFIQLSQSTRNDSISVTIDITKLEPGNLHHTEIQAFHPSNPEQNYSILLTLIVPLRITKSQNFRFQKEIILSDENSFCIFIDPPFESRKKCEIVVTPVEGNNNVKSNLVVQYSVDNVINKNFARRFSTTPRKSSPPYIFPLQSNGLHQICITQRRGSSTPQKLKVEFDFFGRKDDDESHDFMVEDTK